jgi:hypothetical protein
MRRPSLLALALVLALIAGASVVASATGQSRSIGATRCPTEFTSGKFKSFSKLVWKRNHWKREAPKQATILAERHMLQCAAGPGHRVAMKHIWKADKRAFYQHRASMLWLAKYRSFEYPDGSHWAVPYPIALCESGGDYYVGPSGAYGLIPPFPQNLSPKTQDEIAFRLYQEQGEGPWAPYESGCAYR